MAGQYHLITSQTLDGVAQTINKISGTNLAFEGTHQFTRDIQVFSKLNTDSFRNCGYFSDAQTAQETFKNSSEGFQRYLKARFNGTGQEIDWLSWKQSKLGNIFQKSTLPDGNTVEYDGEEELCCFLYMNKYNSHKNKINNQYSRILQNYMIYCIILEIFKVKYMA